MVRDAEPVWVYLGLLGSGSAWEGLEMLLEELEEGPALEGRLQDGGRCS